LPRGNARKVVGILPDVYKDAPTIATPRRSSNHDIVLFGQRALTMADNYGKGWFAILLGKKIDPQTAIPKYILTPSLLRIRWSLRKSGLTC
jgi:putative ATP-dependent endonuclease of OLD family